MICGLQPFDLFLSSLSVHPWFMRFLLSWWYANAESKGFFEDCS